MACFQHCNSVLLPVKYQFMGGEGKRASRRTTQRKANSKKKKGVRHPPLHSCVWRKRRMLCSRGECWVWAMTYWHLILPKFHRTHVLLSDTLSSYRSWPHSYSCFLWSDTPLLLASIKPNHTHQNVLDASYMQYTQLIILVSFPEYLLPSFFFTIFTIFFFVYTSHAFYFTLDKGSILWPKM